MAIQASSNSFDPSNLQINFNRFKNNQANLKTEVTAQQTRLRVQTAQIAQGNTVDTQRKVNGFNFTNTTFNFNEVEIAQRRLRQSAILSDFIEQPKNPQDPNITGKIDAQDDGSHKITSRAFTAEVSVVQDAQGNPIELKLEGTLNVNGRNVPFSGYVDSPTEATIFLNNGDTFKIQYEAQSDGTFEIVDSKSISPFDEPLKNAVYGFIAPAIDGKAPFSSENLSGTYDVENGTFLGDVTIGGVESGFRGKVLNENQVLIQLENGKEFTVNFALQGRQFALYNFPSDATTNGPQIDNEPGNFVRERLANAANEVPSRPTSEPLPEDDSKREKINKLIDLINSGDGSPRANALLDKLLDLI